MNLPNLKTYRLILRQRSMADLQDCLAMDRDPAVTKYIAGPWDNPAEHLDFVTTHINQTYPAGLGYWTVLDPNENNRFLGWIMLLPDPTDKNTLEIGWRFNRVSWGSGYATETATAILDYALVSQKAGRILAEIAPKNIGSIRVAEKLGMVAIIGLNHENSTDIVFEKCRSRSSV